jgi:hypothetical protein
MIDGGVPTIVSPGTAAQAASPEAGVQPVGDRSALLPRLVWRLAPNPAARMTDGWETWRFLPDKRLTRYYPTGTWTITATAIDKDGAKVTEYASFQFRRESKLSSFRVEESKSAVRLGGSLTRVDPRGLTDYGPFGRQRLEILWRPDTATGWERVGETMTDGAGTFTSTISDRKGGLWRVRYTGTGHYAPDVSKSRQIVQ